MRFLFPLLAVLTAALLVQADVSEARGGGGRSFGSRGSRSYQSSPSGAQPLQRSTAAPSNPTPSPSAAPGAPPSSNPITSHPFLSGVAGGVVGAGLGHMLFGGGGGYGGGYGGGGGGGLIPLLLIGGLIFFALRYFRRRKQTAFQDWGGANAPSNQFSSPLSPTFAPAQAGAQTGRDIDISETDIAAFKQLLIDVQQAWSEQNINRLRLCMTPEMVGYFNDELSANISRGIGNKVDHLTIRDVETVEAWQEDNLHYASMRMQWDACDYDIRLDRQPSDADYVASGNRERPETVQEQWTFSRVVGGKWLLSAIQQL